MSLKEESRTSTNMVDILPPAPVQQPVMLVPKGPASASPIGLMAFGMSAILLNFYNAGITESGSIGLIACFCVFHGRLAQLLAGMWEISAGKVLTGTAFTTYGAFYMSTGVFYGLIATGNLLTGDIKEGLCIWLCIWGCQACLMFLVAIPINRGVQFLFLSATLFIFGLAGGVYNETVNKVAGAIGIVCGGSAMFMGWAELMNEAYQREIIPVF